MADHPENRPAIKIKPVHSSVSYQQATYQKNDRRGQESPSGYGPLESTVLTYSSVNVSCVMDDALSTSACNLTILERGLPLITYAFLHAIWTPPPLPPPPFLPCNTQRKCIGGLTHPPNTLPQGCKFSDFCLISEKFYFKIFEMFFLNFIFIALFR